MDTNIELRVPPHPRGVIQILRDRGHTVTVRLNRNGSFPDGKKLRLFPRSRKTTLFTTEKDAIRALDSYSRRLKVNGFRGLVYTAPYDLSAAPTFTMAL